MEIIDVRFNESNDPIILLKPTTHYDERGLFLETFNVSLCNALKIEPHQFIQDNMSRSKYGVLRGLHYQYSPPMAKLVRVAYGKGLDVVVDIRKNSPTYGQYAKFELSDENGHILWVPPGYAHGFLSLTDNTCLCYRTTAVYNKLGEGNINPLDKVLDIDWGLPKEQIVLSHKDFVAQSFEQYTISEKNIC